MSETLDDVVKTGYFINPILLYDMTPSEIKTALNGFAESEKRETRNNNIRSGVIAAAIYEVNRNPKKRKQPYTWKDIFREPQEEKPKQSPTEMKNICKTICKALGGKINGT